MTLNITPDITIKETELAALHQTVQVPVTWTLKPLQWSNEREACEGCRYNHVVAETALGLVSIEWKGWKDQPYNYSVYLAGEYLSTEFRLEEAKEIAVQHLRGLVLQMIADGVKLSGRGPQEQ